MSTTFGTPDLDFTKCGKCLKVDCFNCYVQTLMSANICCLCEKMIECETDLSPAIDEKKRKLRCCDDCTRNIVVPTYTKKLVEQGWVILK